MMRSLWTAASGMISQQQNVDTISNNLANVNTAGYKKERMEFKTLLYETMQRADQDPANPTGRPVNLQMGHGVRPIATAKIYTQGNLEMTNHPLDWAIEGDGFFTIRRGEDDIAYTKDGTFKTAIVEEGTMLVTTEGYPLLGIDGEPIVLPPNVLVKNVTLGEDGVLFTNDINEGTVELGFQVGLVQFANVQGLESVGSNLLKPTAASGDPIAEVDGEIVNVSRIKQGVVEMSNVQIAEEMVELIIAQRAYDLNSKAIQTSDDMLQTATNLKR